MRRPEELADAGRPYPHRGRRTRLGAVVVSAGAHLLIPLALVLLWRPSPPAWSPSDEAPVILSLVQPPPPLPPPEPPTPRPDEKAKPQAAAPAPPKPVPPTPAAAPERPRPRPTPPPPVAVQVLPLTPGPTADRIAELDDAALVGATTAESGAGSGSGAGAGNGDGGSACNMVRRLQAALRGDADVRAAVAEARRRGTGKALLVWDGDWVRDPAQSGKGLAGLRQAIVMEVAFAPEACRADPLRGPVVISMGDGTRLALGRGAWRWSDLLGRRVRR